MARTKPIGVVIKIFLILTSAKGILCDPCKPGNYDNVTFYDNYKLGLRSSMAHLQPNIRPLDDKLIIENPRNVIRWFHFWSPAGSLMPLTAVSPGNCTTHWPIWLLRENSYPESTGEIKDAIACIPALGDDCLMTIDIQIKKCDGFFLHLIPSGTTIPVNNAAFCIGDQAKCPNGTGSPSGFGPTCTKGDSPKIKVAPTIDFTVGEWQLGKIWYREVLFQCNVDTSTYSEDILFDIYWYMDDDWIHTSLDNEKSSFPVKLHEREWVPRRTERGMGRKILCEIYGKYRIWRVPSQPKRSDPLSIGFRVIDKSTSVTEGEEDKHIQIEQLTPVLCPRDIPLDSCTMSITLRSPTMLQESGKQCPNEPGEKKQLVFSSTACRVKIPANDYEESKNFKAKGHSIPIKAVIDGQIEGQDYQGVMRLHIPVHSLHRLWSHYRFETIKVKVIDKDGRIKGSRVCESNNDPHMRTFDGLKYEHPFAGEYILYRHQTRALQVNAFYKKCIRGDVSCNCGVAVRAGRVVYIIDRCLYSTIIKGVPNPDYKSNRIGMNGCDEDALHIYRKAETYTIVLPTGTQVKMTKGRDRFFGNVHITASVADYDRVEGLCGTFNQDTADDFHDKQGNKVGQAVFQKAWKVYDTKDSLYDVKDTSQLPAMNISSYACHCDEFEEQIQCGYKENAGICNSLDGVEITDVEYTKCIKKRDTSYHDHVDDLDNDDEEGLIFNPGPAFNASDGSWRDGWTEEKAFAHCSRIIRGSKMTQSCSLHETIDDHINESIAFCVKDIKIVGSDEWAIGALGNVQNNCGQALMQNISAWTVDEKTNITALPQEVAGNICPKECSLQGECNNGTCTCYDGYSGPDCSVDATAPPEAYKIPKKALCDLQRRPCLQTPVYGDNFQESQNLTCRLRYAKINESSITPTGFVRNYIAHYQHSEEIVCPLPDTRAMISSATNRDEMIPRGYMLRVSNDKVSFSPQELLLTVYDSQCHNCTETGKCKWKENICIIGGRCYEEGSFPQPGKTCLLCMPQSSTTSWTQTNNTCLIDNECYEDNEGRFGEACMHCDVTKSTDKWTRVPGTCFVEQQCYQANSTKPNAACAQCRPSLDNDQWTVKDGFCFIDAQCHSHGFSNAHCSVCDSTKSTTDWTITEVNCYIDGVCYSQGVNHILDGCLICDPSNDNQQWSVKAGHCFIDNICMNDTTLHSRRSCLMCNAAKDGTQWSLKENACLIDDTCYDNEQIDLLRPCFTCSADRNVSSWTQENDTCFIDGNCHDAGEAAPYASCMTCRPSTNTFVLASLNCLINGYCYSEGTLSRDDDCLVCLSRERNDKWSLNAKDPRCRENPVRTSFGPPLSTTTTVATGIMVTDAGPGTNRVALYIGIPIGVVAVVVIAILLLYFIVIRKPKPKSIYGVTPPRQPPVDYDNVTPMHHIGQS